SRRARPAALVEVSTPLPLRPRAVLRRPPQARMRRAREDRRQLPVGVEEQAVIARGAGALSPRDRRAQGGGRTLRRRCSNGKASRARRWAALVGVVLLVPALAAAEEHNCPVCGRPLPPGVTVPASPGGQPGASPQPPPVAPGFSWTTAAPVALPF